LFLDFGQISRSYVDDFIAWVEGLDGFVVFFREKEAYEIIELWFYNEDLDRLSINIEFIDGDLSITLGWF